MLNLSRSDELVTVTIGDAEIICKPYRSQDYTITRFKTAKAIAELKEQRNAELEEGVETKLPNLDNAEVLQGVFTCIFNTELAKLVILEWSGVGKDDEEIPVNDENIELLMADGVIQESFITQYMELQGQIEAEKK